MRPWASDGRAHHFFVTARKSAAGILPGEAASDEKPRFVTLGVLHLPAGCRQHVERPRRPHAADGLPPVFRVMLSEFPAERIDVSLLPDAGARVQPEASADS
jgi:hypothetical protein